MIIKCNKCWSEYETEFAVTDSTVYNCEVCGNMQILDNGVWKNISKEDVEKLDKEII